jgi:hypothetical protein
MIVVASFLKRLYGEGAGRPYTKQDSQPSILQKHIGADRVTAGPPRSPLGRMDYRTQQLSNRRPLARAFYIVIIQLKNQT